MITNKKILSYEKRIKSLQDKIKQEQELCGHDWATVREYNDHDGWSQVLITWYRLQRCRSCGKTREVKTGSGMY
jgi:hypothetical protein